jgi:F-type H+-transporting ATPase subunit b
MSELLNSPEFWVAVAFVIFVTAAFKKVRDGLNSALDGRSARIKAQLDEAQSLREEAQALLAEYQRKQRGAGDEAKAFVEHAKAEAARSREQAQADLEKAVERREQQALEKIEQAEAAALKEVRDQAVDLAIAATAQLLSESVAAQKGEALVDEAIAELPEKLH